MFQRFFSLLTVSTFLCCLSGFKAVGEDDFPQPYNSESDTLAQPMPAGEAAAAFGVPEGIETQVFAAEPEVQNPIAMTWDARGRLWIAENYTYAERSQRFDLNLRDRVVLFSDDSGDGVADRREVFYDQVQILTGIEVGHGGVWLMCPPNLLFIPDRNCEGVAQGAAQVVLDGFHVAEDNYHNFANGLKWGPDGWLYGRCGGSCPGRVGLPGTPEDQRIPLEGGIWRYHVHRRHFEVLVHGTTNPWGHDWDRWGECFFVNTVNGHLWHLIPGAHFDRPFTLDPNPWVFQLLDMHADHWHYDTGGEWFESRDGAADDFGGGHAHIGTMIYQADNWPAEFRDRLFTWNMHGQRANQEILHRQGSGYVAKHAEDCLLAKDPFFRGLDLTYGPDGAVYAIDWSDTGECHEHTGVHRTSGRIFRFSSKSAANEPVSNLRASSSLELARLLSHTNEWHVRQARLILAERSWLKSEAGGHSDEGSLEAAVKWLVENLSGNDERLAYQSLLTLHAMGIEIQQHLDVLLSHANEHLRVWAIRLLLDSHPIDDIYGKCRQRKSLDSFWLRRLVAMAGTDQSGLVRLALASGLQRLPLESRIPIAGALMSWEDDATDHNLPLMVWYGLMPVVEEMPMAAIELAVESRWPKTQHFIARRIANMVDQAPRALDGLISACLGSSYETSASILGGVSEGLKGWRQVPEPAGWSALVESLESSLQTVDQKQTENHVARDVIQLLQELGILFGQGLAWQEVVQLVSDESVEISLRRSALETLVRTDPSGHEDLYISLLNDARLNGIAARGLAASSDDRVPEALIGNYFRFRSPERPSVISILSSRPESAWYLLQAVQQEKIPVHHLTAFDVRQMMAMGDDRIAEKVLEVWGDIRQSDEEKRVRIASLKEQLTATDGPVGDPSRGRWLFEQRCAACHRLFGSGSQIGPDLTGANRSDWDYLLENIIDPSAVVSKDYRMSVIQLEDGRVLSGLVLTTTEQSIELQTQTDRLTLPMDEIEEIQLTTLSPMPDGLLDNLSEQQLKDLFAYLRQPTQVPLPEDGSSVP